MKKSIEKMFVIFIVIFWYSLECSAESCTPTATTFATKTSYYVVGNKDRNFTKPHPSCTPVQINALHRHGHRYPSARHIRELKEMAAKINSKAGIIRSRFNISLPWKCPFKEVQDKLLTPVGEEETYEIAKRIKSRFPELFRKAYTPLVYKFQSTCKLRCVHTANALAAGFFENTGTLGSCKYQPIAIKTADCYHDPLLRPWNACERYEEELEEHADRWMKEYYKFQKGKEIRGLTSKINRKLGFYNLTNATASTHLNLHDVKRLFEACAYHIIMFNGTLNNGICTLLDKEDIEIIEYLYELENFYAYSAGHKLNYQMSCPLLSDMYRSLQDARNKIDGSYTGVFRAAHQETIEVFLTLLGVYVDKNEKLKASNYQEMKKRTFRSACMASYSSNMYFTLYKCAKGEYKIQLYVNENLVKLPCCKSAINCNFDVFMSYYKGIVDNCDFEELCDD